MYALGIENVSVTFNKSLSLSRFGKRKLLKDFKLIKQQQQPFI